MLSACCQSPAYTYVIPSACPVCIFCCTVLLVCSFRSLCCLCVCVHTKDKHHIMKYKQRERQRVCVDKQITISKKSSVCITLPLSTTSHFSLKYTELTDNMPTSVLLTVTGQNHCLCTWPQGVCVCECMRVNVCVCVGEIVS